ncbi:C39 family peptidase [Methanolobus psychrotolerans]|uniref:C39 family peptidase n=1 Tax=Methanolobus psychrotolerans TaxID=1874706 RepID=UPI000B915DFB|nr:C39 family peptidase [Methanolobus psychrotolerans]
MQKLKTKAIFGVMLLMLVAFIPIGSVQAEGLSDSSDVKQVTIELDQKDGVLIIPTEDKKITDLSITPTIEKPETAHLSGTIDENNLVMLEGVITLDGKDEKVQLSGEATQVFVGWDVPEGAKPIYTEVANRTMTRYEGATEMYATYVDVKDKEGKYNLHGEFYEDGIGGFVGTVEIEGKECQLGLLGDSVSMYESVTPVVETKSSYFLTVPQRSQWEIYYYQHNWNAANNACGHTSAAMLEEYWSGNHPSIWSVWEASGCTNMNSVKAQTYLNGKGIYLERGVEEGTLSGTIDEIIDMIDDERPFFLTEESLWGTCHAVVLRGYSYGSGTYPFFRLNDPNTLTGTNVMYWYDEDDISFNYEENVYEYEGSTDDSSTGYSYLG